MERASQATTPTRRDCGRVSRKLLQPFVSSGSHEPLRHWGLEVTRPCERRPLVVALLRQRTINKQQKKTKRDFGIYYTPTSTGAGSFAGDSISSSPRHSQGNREAATARARVILRRAEKSGCQWAKSAQEAGGRVMRSPQRGLLKGPCRR